MTEEQKKVETEEPKKKVVKKKSAPAPADDTGLSAVIDEWDD